MAVQHANRGIVKKDLQLYYNREYLKSFKGEATGNIAYTTNNYLNSNGNWWVNSGSTIFNDNDTSISKPVILNVDTTNLRIFSSTVTATGNQQLGSSIIPISPSTQYTMSIYYWFDGTSMQSQPYLRTNVNNNSLGNFAYNGDTNYLNWPRRTWIRLSITFTTPSNETGVYMSSYTGDNVGEKLAYFGYQLEQKSYSTPLVLGSRAETVTNLYSADPYDGFDFVTVYNYVGSTGATISVVSGIDNPINAPTVLKYSTASGGYVYFALTKSGLSSGTYTVSYYARLESGGPSNLNNAQLWRDNVTDLGVQGDWNPTFYTYWKRFRTTASVTSGTLHFFPLHSGSLTGGFTVYYTGFQLESGDRAKSFTPSSVTANTVASGGGLRDISGNNVNADLTNVLFNGNGYYFNGISNSIYLGTELNLQNGTISAWVNPAISSATTYHGIIGKTSGGGTGQQTWYIDWISGNALRGGIGNSVAADVVTQTWNPTIGTWYFITFVFDNSYLYLYMNGVSFVTPLARTRECQNSAHPVYIGRVFEQASYAWNGQIGQVTVNRTALSAAEVLQNFNATRKTYGI